jgi:uncharacterized protein (TIGR01777 family)
MRFIITGGTGLIGRALTASMTGDGHEVVVLSRNPERGGKLPEGARVVAWDGRTASGWGPLAEGADAIVNLAGENIAAGRWTEKRKRRIRGSRLQAGEAVVLAVREASIKPRVLIQASGIGCYGPRGDEIVTEDTPRGKDFFGRVAVEWEGGTSAVEELGVRRVVIRSAPVLSGTGGVLPRFVTPMKRFVGGPLGSGRQWFPWIHMGDEVRAIRFLVEKESAIGAFNLSAPNPVTNGEFVRTLGRVLRRPSAMRAPGFVLRLLFGEMADLLLEGQRAIPWRLMDLGFEFQFAELEPALRDLLG